MDITSGLLGDWLTIDEIVKEQPDLNRQTLHYWLRNGLPCVKKGQLTLINRGDLTAFMQHRVQKTVRWKLIDKAS